MLEQSRFLFDCLASLLPMNSIQFRRSHLDATHFSVISPPSPPYPPPTPGAGLRSALGSDTTPSLSISILTARSSTRPAMQSPLAWFAFLRLGNHLFASSLTCVSSTRPPSGKSGMRFHSDPLYDEWSTDSAVVSVGCQRTLIFREVQDFSRRHASWEGWGNCEVAL